ncbi:hypothetical protein B0H13DRAFT_2392316 [Mycena leptocephala]|nr:hypothetical protein B0H13DRAFT_2392316 [Mycena leptocephala]
MERRCPGDPEIAQLLYRTICRSIADDSESSELDEFDDSGDPVVVDTSGTADHVLLDGRKIQTAAIYHRSPAPGERLHKYKFSVIDLGIAHDFATRPTVTQVFVKPKVDFGGRTGVSALPPLRQSDQRRGVTVLDVLQAIVRECLVIDSPVLTLRSTNDVTDDMVDLALQGALHRTEGEGKVAQQSGLPRGFRRYEGLEAIGTGFE